MHEVALASGILRMAQDAAKQHNAARITRVRVSLGLLACIEARTLSACFDIVAEGGIAAGAALQVDVEPLPCTCAACGQAFALIRREFACPACGSQDIAFEGGHGCRIMAIEVAEPDQTGTEPSLDSIEEKLYG